MDRCWLKGTEGDALHAVLCAAGFNIRWLMRAIAKQAAKAAKAFVFVLFRLWSWLQMALGGRYATIRQAMRPEDQLARRVGTPVLGGRRRTVGAAG
jgi:IS5 family transposase